MPTPHDPAERVAQLGKRSRDGFPDGVQARARTLATWLRVFAIPQLALGVCLFATVGDRAPSRHLVACLVAAHGVLSLVVAHALPRVDDGGDIARAQLRRAFSRLRWLAIVDIGFVAWLLWRNASAQVFS